MKQTLQSYCMENSRPELVAQWHPLKNGELTPADVSFGSKQKIWWKCEKGHEWQCAVYTRAGGRNGCPYCSRKRPWPGENDLSSQQPQLAAQWHPRKNGTLTPDRVLAGSSRRVWWQCGKGHVWEARISARMKGSGCPVCANRTVIPGENDLSATHPALAAQWHPYKNGALTPEQVVSGTIKRVWWQCSKGHVWQAAVYTRVRGAECPVCAGKKILPGENDLASCYPDLAAQWSREKNEALRPEQLSVSSNRRVWWKCQLGHEWQASVAARTAGKTGCPYCAGRRVLAGFNDLATREPLIAAQWHPELNGVLTPAEVTVASHKKVWWQCSEGHVWKAVIYSRTCKDKCGCPVCAGKVKKERQWRYQQAEEASRLAHAVGGEA